MKGILIFIAAAMLLLFLLLLCSTLERRRFVIRKQNLHLSQLPQAFDQRMVFVRLEMGRDVGDVQLVFRVAVFLVIGQAAGDT